MNAAIRAHEELLAVYRRLGMDEYVRKESAQLERVKSYYGVKTEPIQLSLFYND